MGVRCYYIALSLVIAGFGREFSSLKSRIQVQLQHTQPTADELRTSERRQTNTDRQTGFPGGLV